MPIRFNIGDHVRLVRVGVRSQVGIVRSVDTTFALLPYYLVEFGPGTLDRIPDFDLAPVNEPDQAPEL